MRYAQARGCIVEWNEHIDDQNISIELKVNGHMFAYSVKEIDFINQSYTEACKQIVLSMMLSGATRQITINENS